jgi:DHA1 family multidrug resistance protein-like MFS transporter
MAMNAVTVSYMVGIALGPLLGGWVNDRTHSKLASFYLVCVLFVITALVAFFLTPHRSNEDMELPATKEEGFHVKDLLIGIKSVPDMMLMAFIAFFGVGLLIPVIKYFAMDELNMTETQYGLVVLPIAAAVALASIVTGLLGDRWGKARLVRLGIAFSAGSMWWVTISHTAWELAVAGMLLGVGFVIAMPAWLALISDISAPRCRGAVIGALGTAQGIGAVIGAVMGSYLYNLGARSVSGNGSAWTRLFGANINSHHLPFGISAASLTICMVLVVLFIKDGDTRRIGMVCADE